MASNDPSRSRGSLVDPRTRAALFGGAPLGRVPGEGDPNHDFEGRR